MTSVKNLGSSPAFIRPVRTKVAVFVYPLCDLKELRPYIVSRLVLRSPTGALPPDPQGFLRHDIPLSDFPWALDSEGVFQGTPAKPQNLRGGWSRKTGQRHRPHTKWGRAARPLRPRLGGR